MIPKAICQLIENLIESTTPGANGMGFRLGGPSCDSMTNELSNVLPGRLDGRRAATPILHLAHRYVPTRMVSGLGSAGLC